MDSLKRGRYDFFLIICSELILNGSCGEEGSVFYRNPRPVLGIFIGSYNGTPVSAPYTGANTGVRESSFRELRGKTDLGSFVIYNADYQCFYKK